MALEWLDRGLAALNGQTTNEEAEMSLIAGLIHLRQGNYSRTAQLTERSLQVADRTRDAAVRARSYNLLGIVDMRLGDSTTAVNRFRLSLAQYEELGNVYGQAISHNLVANGHYGQGEWTRADGHYRQSLALFIQMGDLYNQVLVSNNLGGIALKQGRLDAALGYYERAARLLEQTGGSIWVIGALHMNLANTHLQRQELDAAMGELLMAEDQFRQAQLRDLLPELYGLFAEAFLHQGQLDDAEAHGKRSLDLAQELKMPREEGHNLRIVGEIAQARQAYDDAEKHFQQGSQILIEVGDDYERAKIELSLASMYTTLGRSQSALAALDIATAIFERLGAALDLERATDVRQILNATSGPP